MGHHGRVSLTGLDRSRPRPGTGTPGGRTAWRGLPGPDSIWWLALVAAAFTASQLVYVAAHGQLGWDEVVYVSQVSRHAPAAWFDPARSRGVPLLVTPVMAVTSSVTALRVYLAVMSGLGLFGALLAWRRLRPAWVLALAGLVFGGLWVVRYYGWRAMPNLWLALAGLAAVGLFLRAAAALTPGTGEEPSRPAGARRRAWWLLAGLAGCITAATLMRPGDAVFLAAPLVVAALAAGRWRRWQLIAAIVAGLGAGSLEWVIEAYARFGGVFARLHAATAEQGGFGLHLGVLAELHALNGPVQCRPCTIGWQHPALSVWWLALPVLVAFGLFAARRAGQLDSGLLAAVCGIVVAVQYLFLLDYADPRFLIPAYALLAVPVADGLGWLLTGVRPGLRPVTGTLVVAGLALQLASQQGVLYRELTTSHNNFGRVAADLHRLGVVPPCLVRGKLLIPIAYYAGCASAPLPADAGPAVHVAVLKVTGAAPPPWARGWRPHRLHGTPLTAFVRPSRPQLSGRP
jgi:hypothetical protein